MCGNLTCIGMVFYHKEQVVALDGCERRTKLAMQRELNPDLCLLKNPAGLKKQNRCIVHASAVADDVI